MASQKGIVNFAAGPAKLPESVLKKIQNELTDYQGHGMSVMEMSHRSAPFGEIIANAEKSVRQLMDVPDDYAVLFMQGGGTGQFAAVPLNLLGSKQSPKVDYFITGTWSAKAAKEAEKYATVNRVLPKTDSYTDMAEQSRWSLDPEAAYVYYCANETIHGLEFHFIPETNGVPLVCDMSSCIMTKPIPVSKFGIIYAGAQKNIGAAGVTLVIVRKDLMTSPMKHCPSVLEYKIMAANKSLYNTPPAFNIYVMGQVFEWLQEEGGLSEMERRSQDKSSALYNLIDNSNGFFRCPVKPKCRSRMNVPFRIGSQEECESLEAAFMKEAAELGLRELKGHRSVGGIRVSLYNAIRIEHVERLMEFMKQFQNKHQDA